MTRRVVTYDPDTGLKQYAHPGHLLTPTGVKSTAYAAQDGELVRCDLDSGSFTVTAPSGIFVGQRFGVQLFNAPSTSDAVTVQTSGGQSIFNPLISVPSATVFPKLRGANTTAIWVWTGAVWSLESYGHNINERRIGALSIAATITFDPDAQGYSCAGTLNQAGHTLNFVTPASGFLTGKRGLLYLTQDGTGNRTITTYTINGAGSANFRYVSGVKPVLSTAAGALDILEWWQNSSGLIFVREYGLGWAN